MALQIKTFTRNKPRGIAIRFLVEFAKNHVVIFDIECLRLIGSQSLFGQHFFILFGTFHLPLPVWVDFLFFLLLLWNLRGRTGPSGTAGVFGVHT